MLAVVVVAGVSGRSGKGEAEGGSSTTASTAVVASSLAATSSLPPVVTQSTLAPGAKTSLKSTLAVGSVSDDVKMVQERMAAIGFNPGPVDGEFGQNTKQAVWAFEKLVLGVPRAQATGQVTNDTWQRMQDNDLVKPRRPQGLGTTHMEIYLPEQVGVVFTDDRPVMVAHIASGELENDKPKKYCEKAVYDTDANGNVLDPPVEKQICGEAKTPGGVFEFYRRYTGVRKSALGGMTNPVYFNYGIAVHGAINVPLEPASHGCIRINQTLAKIFPSLVKDGDKVFVWGHDGKQPEDYSKKERLPVWDYLDPNATTTTSTTTSTVPPTTKPGASTTKPTPTSPPTTPSPATTVPATTAAPLSPEPPNS